MPPREIRFDPESVAFCAGGETLVEISRDDAVVAALEAVADATAASFERALADYEEQDAASVTAVFLCDVPFGEFDPDLSPRETALDFLGGRLSAQVGRALDGAGGPALDVAALLAPLLERHGGELVGDYRHGQEGHLVELHMLALTGEDRTIGELHALAVEAQALLDAASGGGALSARTVRDLLAGGRAGALLGQPEAAWIDAKGEPQRLNGELASFELAKDVAAFANTGQDAIIVWGLETVKGPGGGDVLDAVRPFKLSSVDLPAMVRSLADRLAPLLIDLDLDVVEVRSGSGYGLGWILIPAQPAHVRPVLVRGALVAGKVLGSHVSVPVRVGEETRHWDASTVHSLIQAGRVALQRVEALEADGG